VKNVLKTVALLALLASANGNPLSAEERATVILYREAGRQYGTDGLAFPLYVNAQRFCQLSCGCYVKLDLAPGDYVFNLCRVHLAAGQTLYLLCCLGGGGEVATIGQPDSQACARETVSKFKELKRSQHSDEVAPLTHNITFPTENSQTDSN
jgi:hypothetical protein